MPDEQIEQKKKQITLKQYLVSGSPPGARRVRKAAFILTTCPKFANEEFLRKFPDCRVWSTRVTATSDMTKEDMEGHDFWAEKNNWILFDRNSDEEPSR